MHGPGKVIQFVADHFILMHINGIHFDFEIFKDFVAFLTPLSILRPDLLAGQICPHVYFSEFIIEFELSEHRFSDDIGIGWEKKELMNLKKLPVIGLTQAGHKYLRIRLHHQNLVFVWRIG